MSEKTEHTTPGEVASPSDVAGAPGPPGPPAAPSLARTAGPPGPPGSAPAQRARLKRRPTGAPPPLPHPITISTTAWLLLAAIILAGAFLFSERTPWLRVGDGVSTWILRRLADVRTPWLTDLAHSVNAIGSGWAVTAVALSAVVLTMIFRRWRHLLVFIGSLFVLAIVAGNWIYDGLSRPRPYGVWIIGGWGGYSAPSVVGAVYLGAALIAAVSPAPGGLGAIETALITGLTGIGVSSGAAVSAVILYRLATYWLPVLPGWLSLRQLQRMGYV